MSGLIRPSSRDYPHGDAMAWLHRQFSWSGFGGPKFLDDSRGSRHARIAWLRRKCVAMRAAGIAGSWHYDLPLHTELCRILKAELAELAAIESLPAFPDRQRLRAA